MKDYVIFMKIINVCKPHCMHIINPSLHSKFKRKKRNVIFTKIITYVNRNYIHNDATATPNNRYEWIGKTNFPLLLSFFDFSSTSPQQFLQRETMPKSPSINNNIILLFVSLIKFWVFPPDFQLASTGINRDWATFSPQLSESILQSKQWSFNN